MNGTAAAIPADIPTPTTRYVGAAGGGNYTTIQAAVNSSSSGDTIIVYPGTYTENVNVNKQNLVIRSYSGNPDDTIVIRSNLQSHNFKISANDVTIRGFKITGAGSTGIFMSGVSGANIINNKLSGVGCGIQMESSSRCNLVNNTVSDSADKGFYLSSSSNCTMVNNTISDTDSYGIYLYSSNYSTLTNNKISDTGSYGIYLYSSSNCALANNTVSDTDDDNICLYYSSGCNLTDNIFSSTYDGISLYESKSCNLTGNTISNADDGIYLYESDSCNLTGNTISNADCGISLGYSSECILRNNTASSGRSGIRLRNIENSTLTGNIMSGNRYNFDIDIYDISDFDNTPGNIIDTSNLVDGKAVYYLEREPNPSIGRDAGVIYCINCGDVEIKDLVLQNNSYAVFLYNTSSEIQNNTINNTIYGVGVLSSQDVRISENRIENSGAGIVFEEAMNITLTDNTVRNSIYGIVTFDSENCTLKGNYIQNTKTDYSYYTSVNSELVRSEENTLKRDNPLMNSNLVQSRKSYGFGIYSGDCQDLKLENNIIDQADFIGIYLEDSQNVRLVGNSVRNIGYLGIYSDGSVSVELLDNTVQNVTGEAQLYSAGNSPLVSSPLVSKSLGPSSGCGICFGFSQDLRLEGNTVEDCNNAGGIYLYEPGNATLESNTIKNCMFGLLTYMNDNCSVSDCSVINCTSGGILIINQEEVPGTEYTMAGCTVEGSVIGLLVTGEGTLAGNTLSGNSYGMVLYDVNNSLIYGNTITQNSLAGLAFDVEETELIARSGLVRSMEGPESGNNTIYNNYFNNVNNTLISSGANNSWNTSRIAGTSIVGGPYLGGNYWANPNGTGFSENCTDTDKDGIAESSYEFVNGTFDYLPLAIIPPTPTITSTTHKHTSSTNYVPSSGESVGVTGTDRAQKRVVARTETSFRFNNPVSGILGLRFTSEKYSGNVVVRVEVLGDGSSGEKPEGEVYQLMNILVGNERFESGTNIKRADINFRVSRSWVEENNIDVSTITMNRLHDEEWNALSTEMTGEDEEYYYFRAETPGFSRYAITGDKLGTEIITPAEVEETETVIGEEQTEKLKRSTPGFESTFAILGVLASVFFAKRRILK